MKLDQLHQVAEETLGGLKAGPGLLYRAQKKVQQRQAPLPQRRMHRGLAMALSLVLVLGLAYLTFPKPGQPVVHPVETIAAGSPSLPEGSQTRADLPRGSLTLSKAQVPEYQGVWARGSGANFPLIRIDGRYYRLLTHPKDVSGIIGSQIGQVSVFENEPALDNSGSVLSNAVPADTPVYAVSGMGQSVVAAPMDGQTRLFQRVSFAGNGLTGGESLRDALPSGAVALQLSGVGTISEPALVSQLLDTLYHQSVYLGAHSKRGDQALLVQYSNGIVLQLAVSGDELSGPGTFSSPDFIRMFKEQAQ